MKPPSPYTREGRAEANYYRLGGDAFFQMKRYLNDMRSLMQSHRFKLQESQKEELEKYPLYPWIINRAYGNRYRDMDIHFVRILLNSSFIASFSIFEVMFKDVCHLAAYKYSQKFESDFNTGIDKCRSYLVRNLRIDISDLSDYWKKLLQYRELRNSMVHHDCRIVKDQSNTMAFVKRLEHVKIKKVRSKGEYMFTISDRQFVNEFLDCASEFLANVLLKLPKGKRKRLNHVKQAS